MRYVPNQGRAPSRTALAANEGSGPDSGQPSPGSAPASRGPERELVERAQRGDRAAFEELVRLHQKRVFAIVSGVLRRREDIEDVAQQVFLKVFLSLRRFNQRSAFSTWLYKVAVNECRDYLRKKRARPLVYEADLSEDAARSMAQESGESSRLEFAAGSAPFDQDARQRAERRQLIERLLAELSDEDRMILLMKEVEGFPVEEISEITGLNVNTIKVRLFRARGRMAEYYRRRLGTAPRNRPGQRNVASRGLGAGEGKEGR